jgi:hypothetical protein
MDFYVMAALAMDRCHIADPMRRRLRLGSVSV